MKIISLESILKIFIGIIISISIANSQLNFDIMPTNIHFFGSVATSKNIIAYGNLGSYLITTDGGKSWNQKAIDDFGEIRKIVNYNDTLWGIINTGSIIRSTDHGLNWTITDIRKFLNHNDLLANILVTEKFVYTRSYNSIICFDKNLNYINKNTDSLLDISYVNEIKPGYVDRLWYDEMYFCFNKIIANSYWYTRNGGIIVLSEDLTNLDTIRIEEKIHFYHPTMQTSCYLENLFSIKDQNIFNFSGNLFTTNEDFLDWNYYFGDTTLYNVYDSLYPLKWNEWGYLTTEYCFSHKDNLFAPYCKKNREKGSVPSLFHDPADIIDFGYQKFDFTTKRYMPYNSMYMDNYYSSKYFSYFLEGSIGYTRTVKPSIFQDTVFVLASFCKTIVQTRDDCKTWELVSNMNGVPKIIINDSTYYYIDEKSHHNDINRTTNYGVTFFPTEYGLDTGRVKLLVRDSLGNVIDTIFKTFIDSYLSRYKQTTLFYIDSTGKGFWSGADFDIDPDQPQFAYTTDGGKHFKFKRYSNLGHYYISSEVERPSNVLKIADKYLFASSSNLDYPYLYDTNYGSFHRIFLIDTSFETCSPSPYNKYLMIHHILAENLQNYRILATSQDKNDLYKLRFEIRETNDSGKTFTTINAIESLLIIDQIYELNKDSVFFSTLNPARLYLYDRQRNVIDTLYKGGENDTVKLMIIGPTFYLVGNNLFLVNSDRKDLSKWELGNWDYGIPSFESVIFKGNVAIAKLSDSRRPLNYYRILLKNATSVVENKLEVKYYNNHFYATPSFPLPAKLVAKSTVYWDKSFDLDKAIQGVYNIYGERIETKENIHLNYLDASSAEIIWNCASVSSGVYFILVFHNGIIDCIPVLVEK